MGATTLTLEPAGEDTLPYVEGLLEANGLPSADVRSKPECFYLGYDGDERVGVGGIEVHGSAGLLRSVAVERSARSTGHGTAICERLEAAARDEGVGVLYLLTTTARGFFAERGYVEIERDGAPDAIRGTSEFADLCPATATCMRKRL
ncbi:MAG: arsenic resistance N-acetyltransferase ArsN2 [Haloarculaceae archaeon]